MMSNIVNARQVFPVPDEGKYLVIQLLNSGSVVNAIYMGGEFKSYRGDGSCLCLSASDVRAWAYSDNLMLDALERIT